MDAISRLTPAARLQVFHVASFRCLPVEFRPTPATDCGVKLIRHGRLMSLLECSGLAKTYPGGKRAVNGVSFYVDPGEIVGLLGPNGAGKTTTFRMACGLIAPTEGRVMLNGK